MSIVDLMADSVADKRRFTRAPWAKPYAKEYRRRAEHDGMNLSPLEPACVQEFLDVGLDDLHDSDNSD